MSKPTPKTPQMIEHMLTSLETPHKELTKWEENFVQSIGNSFIRYKKISDRQFEILERIYAEKTE